MSPKPMVLTIEDIKLIRQIVQEEGKAIRQDLETVTTNLPTKQEFFTRMDHISSELLKARQEQVAIVHQMEQQEHRISSLEAVL